MLNYVRVLVIDDSVIARKLLTDALSADPELEVVGTAANGRIGLAKLAQLRPDVVTMDVEMPDMDGLQAVTEIRKVNPRIPIIMFSGQTDHGARATLDAIARGATDYVFKPTSVGGHQSAVTCIQAELIPKIKALVRGASFVYTPASAPPPRPGAAARVDAVVIGCSTGGPAALPVVLSALPKPPPVPVFIVQHMPPLFTRQLAANLAKSTGLAVAEARDGEVVEAGEVWLAAGGSHLTVRRGPMGVFLRFTQDPPEHGCRPAVDPLFRTAAEVYKAGTLAVVLTGMGKDGAAGAQAIHAARGRVLAQDEATSVVWGMPSHAVRAGVTDAVLPLSEIGPAVAARLRVGRSLAHSLVNA